MKNRTLNFKDNKVEHLTLEELKNTVNEKRVTGYPVHGIQHYELLESIQNRLDVSGLDYNLAPISAVSGGERRSPGVTVFDELSEKYGKGSLQSHLLRRFITMFMITSSSTEEYNYGLAVAFHQNGIQVAYGPNIRTCDNMCIMNPELMMATYGPGKIKHDKMLEVVGEWLTNFETHRERDIKILERMKEIQCTYRDVAELTGHLTFMRVGSASKEITGAIHQPLNQGQITVFTERYLKYYQDHKFSTPDVRTEENDTSITLYELFNLATEMHKAGNTDLPLIIQSNYALGKFLIERYRLAEAVA